MNALSLRGRALSEIRSACDDCDRFGHGRSFLFELDAVFGAIQRMPLRFPLVLPQIHRALLRRYPYAVFFRIRASSELVVVLAVLHQRRDPGSWPRR